MSPIRKMQASQIQQQNTIAQNRLYKVIQQEKESQEQPKESKTQLLPQLGVTQNHKANKLVQIPPGPMLAVYFFVVP